jgi:hypothetical protein
MEVLRVLKQSSINLQQICIESIFLLLLQFISKKNTHLMLQASRNTVWCITVTWCVISRWMTVAYFLTEKNAKNLPRASDK